MPRKLRADSVRIAPATPSVAVTRTDAIAFGRIWRKMIRKSEAPITRAAWMKSRSLSEMKSARTSRVTPIQPVRPITIMMFQMEGSSNAITAKMRKKAGKQSMMSTNRMITASTHRP